MTVEIWIPIRIEVMRIRNPVWSRYELEKENET
jgi:hypothetical protein